MTLTQWRQLSEIVVIMEDHLCLQSLVRLKVAALNQDLTFRSLWDLSTDTSSLSKAAERTVYFISFIVMTAVWKTCVITTTPSLNTHTCNCFIGIVSSSAFVTHFLLTFSFQVRSNPDNFTQNKAPTHLLDFKLELRNTGKHLGSDLNRRNVAFCFHVSDLFPLKCY